MFARSDAGGERAAAIYSLVGSAKLLGLAPEHFLPYVLARIAEHPINPIDDLLPAADLAAEEQKIAAECPPAVVNRAETEPLRRNCIYN